MVNDFPPPVVPTQLIVSARTSALALRGPLPVTKLDAVLRHSSVGAGVGTWVLEMDATHPKAARVLANGGIHVTDQEGRYLFSGPTKGRVTVAPDKGNQRVLTVQGVTDEACFAKRIVYPDPALSIESQTTTAYYTATGNGETLLRTVVNTQAGPGAIVARRIPGLVLETNQNRGGTAKINARFSLLGPELSAMAQAAGLSWRVAQVGTSLVFQVYVPRDLTRRARFSREGGSLRGYTYGITAPEATVVIVAGQGTGTAREVIEVVNAAAVAEWGRIEYFIDRRDTADPLVLQQAGEEALAERGPSAQLIINPLDLPKLRYGQDYGLGDTVTVEADGATITDVVRQVTLSYTDAGLRVTPLVGDEAARDSKEPENVRRVKELLRRVAGLETRE